MGRVYQLGQYQKAHELYNDSEFFRKLVSETGLKTGLKNISIHQLPTNNGYSYSLSTTSPSNEEKHRHQIAIFKFQTAGINFKPSITRTNKRYLPKTIETILKQILSNLEEKDKATQLSLGCCSTIPTRDIQI
jgi:hypothetical protein